MSSGERERRYVFLKYFWSIFVDDIFKYYHVSTRMEFMWGGVNVRVPCYLIHFILALPYKLLGFIFGPLSFVWSCT